MNTIEKSDCLEKLPSALKKLKIQTPITDCITNIVTTNDCANAILAIGGSAIMADDSEELEEILEISSALVVNTGKLSKDQINAMKSGCYYANTKNKPIVLDPVGVGISNLRNSIVSNILEDYDISVIRGNMSEIKNIAQLINLTNEKSSNKGLDVSYDDLVSENNLKQNIELVNGVAKKLDTVVVASGVLDLVSDGSKSFVVVNGDELMSCITGTGCMLTSIIGASVGVNNPLLGSILGLLVMGIAGENAAKYIKDNNLGTGSFKVSLIDGIYKLKGEDIISSGNLFEY